MIPLPLYIDSSVIGGYYDDEFQEAGYANALEAGGARTVSLYRFRVVAAGNRRRAGACAPFDGANFLARGLRFADDRLGGGTGSGLSPTQSGAGDLCR